MDIDIQIEEDVVRFKIAGAIDNEGGSELSNKFMEVAGDDSIMHAVFDLTDTDMINSAGIGKLLNFFKHFDKKGGSFKIKGISEILKKQFDEVHLDQIITIED